MIGKPKTFKKMISVTETTNRLIKEIMETKGESNFSLVVRDAVFEMHKKLRPRYLEPTINQKIKEKEISEEEAFEQMTDREYALSIPSSLIMKSDDGIEYLVVHWWANTLKAFPIDGLKEFFTNGDREIIPNHISISAERSISDMLKLPSIRQDLKNQYNIIIPENA